MARKLTRFTVAADGSLVYASTGARAPSDYYLVRDASGRAVGVYRVQDNAVGRVRVGSFQEAKNLPARQKQRVRRAQQKRGWPGPSGDIGPMGPQALRPQVPGPGMEQAAASGLLSIRDRGYFNYSRRLKRLVEEGKMTQQEQDTLLAEYTDSQDYHRREMWDDLNEEYAGGRDERYGSP